MKKSTTTKTILILLFTAALWGNIEDECLSGDANACYQLGEAYLYGKDGFVKDEKTAKAYLDLACGEKVQKACDELGQTKTSSTRKEKMKPLLVPSVNIKEDKDRCLKGDMEGCYLLGIRYWYGYFETKSNITLAKQFFDLACEGEHYRSCGVLAALYISEEFADYNKAKKYGEIACEHKIGNGCLALSYMYREGKGVKKDTQLSNEYAQKDMKYFQKSCEQGIGAVCSLLGVIYSAAKDDKKSLYFHQRACELNDLYSCAAASSLNADSNVKKAVEYARKSCELGFGDFCFLIAAAYETGEGNLEVDKNMAKKYYQMGCELGCEGIIPDCDTIKNASPDLHCQ